MNLTWKYIYQAEAETLTSSGLSGAGDTLLDMDTVTNLSFDDMAEAPGFVTPPNGVYDITLDQAKMEKYATKATPEKSSENKTRIKHMFTINKVFELSDGHEQEPSPGSKFSIQFMVNENGLKFWKTHAKDVLGEGATGSNLTLGAILAELSSGNYRFKARVSQKTTEMKDANGRGLGKNFTNIQVKVLEPLSVEGEVSVNDESKI